MAYLARTAVSISARPRQPLQATKENSNFRSVSFTSVRTNFPAIQMRPAPSHLQICCAAKSETLEKVCEIVKKQLALAEGTVVTGESKFSDLGADSLDTVEIVMGFEEAFGISVEEENAQSIETVQDAADLIEKLVEAKSG